MNKFEKNRNKLITILPESSVAIVFAGEAPYKRGDEQYPFSPDRNFYYVTGIERESCIFFMGKTTKETTKMLYISRDNGELAKWVGANMTVEEAKKISAIDYIGYLDEFTQDLGAYLFKNQVENIYLDLENRDWNALSSKGLAFAKDIIKQHPSVAIQDVYPIFSEFRLIKEDWELEHMKQAMEITQEAFLFMMENTKAGMMEYEIEAYFDYVLTKRGVRQKAFQTIAASGKRGCILHYGQNNHKTGDGDLILVDAGALVNWYAGDITRTFPVNGKFSPRQKEVYEIVLEGHRKVIEAIKPELPFSRLNEILKEHYFHALKKIGLVKEIKEVSAYYYHSVSHFLGAETHDVGRYKDIDLKEGMVLTVEPGLYIPQWEIGIRIEDDVLVTQYGSEVLTQDLIRTVDEIERFMAKSQSI